MSRGLVLKISESRVTALFAALVLAVSLCFPPSLVSSVAYADAGAQGGEYLGWSDREGAFLYVGQVGTNERYVAYCFNSPRPAPPSKKKSNVIYKPSDDFSAALADPSSVGDTKALNEKLRKALYHGYVENASGLDKMLAGAFSENIIPAKFNECTQWVVWHYTDGFDPRAFKAPMYRDYPLARPGLDAQYAIYDKLVSGDGLAAPPDSFKMQLYTTDMTNADGKRYQNLLAAGENRPTPGPTPNERQNASIKILKVAVKDGAIQNKVLSGAEFELYYGPNYDGPNDDGSLTLLRTFTTEDLFGNDEVADSATEIPLSDFAQDPQFNKFLFKLGKAFTLVETKAPDGFEKLDKPIVFTLQPDAGYENATDPLDTHYHVEILDDSENWVPVEERDIPASQFYEVPREESDNFVIVENKEASPSYAVQFAKTDEQGTPLPGAKFELYKSEADGLSLISSIFTANAPETLQLKEGDYALMEMVAPEGYESLKSAIKFHVNADGAVQLVDDRNNGLVTVQGLNITAKNAPEAPAPTDAEVSFSKTAVNGGDELPGARLKVVRGEDPAGADVVDAWTSTETAHPVRLAPGTYTMVEESAPAGYLVAESIVFRVTDALALEVRGADGRFAPAADSTVAMRDALAPTDAEVTPSSSDDGHASNSASEESSVGKRQAGDRGLSRTGDGSSMVAAGGVAGLLAAAAFLIMGLRRRRE